MRSPELADEVPGYVTQASNTSQANESPKNPDDSEESGSLDDEPCGLLVSALHVLHPLFVSLESDGPSVHCFACSVNGSLYFSLSSSLTACIVEKERRMGLFLISKSGAPFSTMPRAMA